MGGHLFITHGDLLHLACDAILIPSGTSRAPRRSGHDPRPADRRFGEIVRPWTSLLAGPPAGADPPPSGFLPEHCSPDDEHPVRLCLPARWPHPAIWAGLTGSDHTGPEQIGEVIRTFIERATQNSYEERKGADGTKPTRSRRCPLLAFPLVGTGEGGHGTHSGEVLQTLVSVTLDALGHQKLEVDAALVLHRPDDYSAAQQARLRELEDTGRRNARRIDPRREWSTQTRAAFDRLVDHAKNGSLVAFIGAGTSMAAGLPSWTALLRQLLGELPDDATGRPSLELDDLLALDYRDLGTLLEKRLGADGLREAIRSAISPPGRRDRIGGEGEPGTGALVSIHHQLLASIEHLGAITTNYDTLFETAVRDTGRSIRSLPSQDDTKEGRWLLKLHGSVGSDTEARNIVISRQDYLRLDGEHRGLSAIVASTLLTRHLVFVGYSLNDDDFHRIFEEVRETLRSFAPQSPGSAPLATALTDPGSIAPELWSDVDFVVQDYRDQEIFLDLLAAEAAAPGRHLLQKRYNSVFTNEERQLAERVRALRDAIAAVANVREPLRRELLAAIAPFVSGSETDPSTPG